MRPFACHSPLKQCWFPWWNLTFLPLQLPASLLSRLADPVLGLSPWFSLSFFTDRHPGSDWSKVRDTSPEKEDDPERGRDPGQKRGDAHIPLFRAESGGGVEITPHPPPLAYRTRGWSALVSPARRRMASRLAVKGIYCWTGLFADFFFIYCKMMDSPVNILFFKDFLALSQVCIIFQGKIFDGVLIPKEKSHNLDYNFVSFLPRS